MDDIEGIIGVLGGVLLLLIPVAGITARFALKPVIDAFATNLKGRAGNEALQLVERRLALVEQELAALRGEMTQVEESTEFYRKLAEGKGELAPADG
jgi:hypothetical protein